MVTDFCVQHPNLSALKVILVDSWNALRKWSKEKRADADDPHRNLERCFSMSLSELKDTERRLYAARAIFKEDEPLREVAIRQLWSTLKDFDEDEIEELLNNLAARVLLQVAGKEFPCAAVLHDLLRDFMSAELGDSRAAHEEVINASRQTQTGAGWHTATYDGYLYDPLGYHLCYTGARDEFYQLLGVALSAND